jgi:hypothetical protein
MILLRVVSRLKIGLMPYFQHAKWSLPDWYNGVGRYNLVTTLEPLPSKTLPHSPHLPPNVTTSNPPPNSVITVAHIY